MIVNGEEKATPGENLSFRLAIYVIMLIAGLAIGYRFGLKKSKIKKQK